MKHINIFLGLITAFLLNSCFSDNGNYNYKDPLNIHIEGVKNAYTVSPTGDKLQISPKIYPEGRQYDCFWAIIPASASWGEQLDTISHKQELDYAVNLNVGSYKLRLCAKDRATGVFAYEEYDLHVTTDMNTGWWVLKSENDSTDIDFFSDEKTKTDIIHTANGHHLQGLAQNLYFTFCYWDFDESTQKDKRVNAVFIASRNDLAALDYFTGKIIRGYDALFIDKMYTFMRAIISTRFSTPAMTFINNLSSKLWETIVFLPFNIQADHYPCCLTKRTVLFAV